ncbi:hypothetical protein [Sphingomonas aracearum]|nr:hypothetical protein [Sphingomonas aracearum]
MTSASSSAISSRVNAMESSAGSSFGLNANGDFSLGSFGWGAGDMDFPALGGGFGYLASSRPGVYGNLASAKIIKVADLNRGLHLQCFYNVYGNNCRIYLGLTCYDASHNGLGNVYARGSTDGPGGYQVDWTYKGVIDGASVPVYGVHDRLPPGTAYVQLIFYANYPDSGGPFPGGYVQISQFWLEEVGSVQQARGLISDEATTRSNADSALSGRVSTTEAKLNLDQDSNLYARIRSEETARANGDGALATRASNLEVSATASSVNTLNQNPSFSFWTDPNGLPNGWGWWIAQGTVTRNQTDNSSGGYAFRHNIPAGYEGGIMQGACRLQPGWYVMEADIELLDGNLTGAGLTVEGVFNLDFAREPDVNKEVSAGGWKRRRFTKLFYCDRPLNNWHAMTNWGSFAPLNYKYMDWHYCGVRPATAGEILAQKVDNDVNGAGGAIARIGAEETARANGDSALAGRTTVVEAQVSNDSNNLVRNATFNAPGWGRGSYGIPPYWGGWAQDNGGYIGWNDRPSKYGAPCPLQIDRQGDQNGITQYFPAPIGAGWYVIEADVDFEDGNHAGSGVHVQFNNGYARNLSFGTEPDTNGGIGSFGNVNRKFSTLFYNGANSPGVSLYLMAGWTGFTGTSWGYGFLRTIWHKVTFRPASEGEIAARKVQDANITARVASVESTTATINGKTQAYFSKTASVPGATAFIAAQALNDQGQATSDVAIGGSMIALYNTQDGSAKRAMYLTGGNAVFDGQITARTGVRVGTGTFALALAPADFPVSNGTVINYGYDLGRVPAITFGACPIALNPGEVYQAYAENASSTGFTARLLIQSAPVSSNQSVGPGYSVNGSQAYDIGKGTPDASNGSYTFNCYGTLTAYGYREDYSDSCVSADAYVPSGKQAFELAPGDEMLVLNESMDGYTRERVQQSYVAEEESVSITTETGITLTASVSTPITLRDGRQIRIREVLGEDVAVLDQGTFRWEKITYIEEVGVRRVARVSVNNNTYAAGDEPERMIFTHNIIKGQTPGSLYYAEGSATIGLWTLVNGGWVRAGQGYVWANGTYSTGGAKQLSWSLSQAVSSGGYVSGFRITIDASDYGAAIGAFQSVTWVTQSTSGSRSATPNGEIVTATVRPQ